MSISLTAGAVLILAALILAIMAAAGKGGPLALPVAVVLLALASLIERLPR